MKLCNRLKFSVGILIVALFLLACGSASDDRSFPSESASGGTSSSSSSSSSAQNTVPIPDVPAAVPAPAPAPQLSSQVINSFLWKPESERSGDLVVLVNPLNITVVVTGDISETLSNTGPSNGRGTTARGSFSGCTYGSNVLVEFFDSRGQRVRISNGKTAVRIPNGCDRFEF